MEDTENNGSIIECDPEKFGGKPVFPGTRIPIYILFDYIEHGEGVGQFLENYEIEEEKVRNVLNYYNIQ